MKTERSSAMTERERINQQPSAEPAPQRAGQPMMCLDLMTDNPICCLPSDTVVAATRIMRDEDVGSVPVVDDQQRLLGIITDRDVALRVVADARDPGGTTVQEVMTIHPVTCHPDDDVRRALDLMAQHQIRRIPVVGADRRLLGIIAQADIATRMDAPTRTAAVVEEISQPSAD
jgi:CBS domain-containing protein